MLPGGMAHTLGAAANKRLTLVTSGLKDVILPDSAVDDSEPKRLPAKVGERFSISSRVAESLYLDPDAILNVLRMPLDNWGLWSVFAGTRWLVRNSETHWPLLQAVAAATEQAKYAKSKKPPADTLSSFAQPECSIAKRDLRFALASRVLDSLESVREVISPECREALEETSLYLRSAGSGRMSRSRLQDICERMVSEVARFNGTAGYDASRRCLAVLSHRSFFRAQCWVFATPVALPHIESVSTVMKRVLI